MKVHKVLEFEHSPPFSAFVNSDQLGLELVYAFVQMLHTKQKLGSY